MHKEIQMLKHFVSAHNFLADRIRSDRGATAVEYGLLVALIAAVIVGIVVVVGHQVSNAFQSVSNSM
jgi:pilus assembly protein Flp/PilA